MKNIVKLPQLAWYGVRDYEIKFPENWQVEICNMKGYDRPSLTPDEMRRAIRNPLGTLPIHRLARGKQQVVIIFDDVQRATRVSEIVPFILEELAEAGIPDDCIRFVCATGCHAAMDRIDLVKKVGEDVIRRFPVYNHHAFANCTRVGVTKYGTEILANSEVMSCDLKIAIGGVIPHRDAGFSGGSKIVLPGICAFETNRAFHQFAMECRRKNNSLPARGDIDDNPLRMNMDEAVKMVGLDFKIDVLTNNYGETVALYAGEPEAEFAAAVAEARSHYLAPRPKDCDVVIANVFSKVGEFQGSMEVAFPTLRQDGGDVVLIYNSPGGHVAHYLFSSWGTVRRPGQMRHALPSIIRHLYLLNEYPEMAVLRDFGEPDRISAATRWNDVLESLKKSHSGQVRVAVYPAADIVLQ